ncbi:MAG: trypsin-like peptidase domain-containing protein, partial [Williamsia herbipolensis]|nr:trypsin-like peptidase domain-containing protein [Williamsia herbipolensis]
MSDEQRNPETPEGHTPDPETHPSTVGATPAPDTAPTANTAPDTTPTSDPAPAAAPAYGEYAPGASFGPAANAPQPVPAGPATTTATPARRSIAVPVVVALVVGALLGGATGGGIAVWGMSSVVGTQDAGTAKPQSITVNDTKKVNATTAIAAKAGPSVVTIDVSSSSAGAAGTGSGVILDTEGHILTNTHVVTLDGETSHGTIQVTLSDGTLSSAKLVGTDPTMDLAVIKLDNPPKDLQPISFADSDKINVGDQVVAIGAPLGLANTVTDGIVSALNRSIEIASSAAPKDGDSSSGGGSGNNGNGPFDFWNFGNGNGNGNGQQQQQSQAESTIKIPVVQTDAAINPGNSGGALVDGDAKLIGINVAIASTGSTSGSSAQSGSIGVGFAIPSDVAKRIADEIIESGKATHGLLGASVTDATAKDSSTVGAVIAETPVSGGAADSAGLAKGDVVTRFDGHPITGAADLTAQVRALAAGSKADLTYVRDGRAKTVSVTLGTLQS